MKPVEPAVLLLVVESDCIRSVSGMPERVTGYSPDELVRMEWPALFHSESRARVALLSAGDPSATPCDVRLVRKNGNERCCRLHGTAWYTRGGPVVAAALADTTSQRAAERRLRQFERGEAIGRLAGGIAHDFNNLLTVILGQADFLLGDLVPGSPTAEGVESIRSSARRASSLVRELLSFGRQQRLDPVPFDLGELVSHGARLWAPILGQRHNLVLRVGPADRPVFADRERILEALLNLVLNARDAMPNGGTILIETSATVLDDDFVARHPGSGTGQHAVVSVTDSGCGLSLEARERLFEPFFTTKGPEKGTGLGLATVYGTVKQSGGSIWASSEPGQGTTFKVYLPVLQDAAARGARPRPHERTA